MEKLLTVQQLCELLQVSKRTVYEWTHMNFVPHYKFPKGIRFKESDILIWLRKRKYNGRVNYKNIQIL